MDDRQFLERVDEFIAASERGVVDSIARLVAVESVAGEPAPGAPSGAGTRAALNEALAMAREMGLDTRDDGAGYMGWAELPGAEKGHLATIAHLDIVPPGDGWAGDPYKLAQRDGWLIGRGVVDDKGPAALCLWAAKFFKQSGEKLRYGLRVLLGTEEETGMRDVAAYLKDHEAPLFAFSPDANFPVCNGEKGRYLGIFTSGVLENSILEFNAGLAPNVIPGTASCLVDCDPETLGDTRHITVSAEGCRARLTATGVGGHAASPEGAVNAIGLLVNYLLDRHLCEEPEIRFLTLMRSVLSHTNGRGLDIDCADDAFGALTINGGEVRLKNGRMTLSVDLRYPTATNGETLFEKLTSVARDHSASFKEISVNEPFFIPADAPAIDTLLDCYNSVTGRAEKPFTMGGGTYARHFPAAVSYGPVDNGTVLPDFAGPEHGANEGLELAAALRALKIYIYAIWKLQQVDF